MPICKQCKTPKLFSTISILRTHQWAKHKEMYKKFKAKRISEASKANLVPNMTAEDRNKKIFKCAQCGKRSKGHKAMMRHAWTHRDNMMAGKMKSKELIPAVKTVRDLRTNGAEATHTVEPHQVLEPEMTVSELLHKIQEQKDFLNGMYKFIEGMVAK